MGAEVPGQIDLLPEPLELNFAGREVPEEIETDFTKGLHFLCLQSFNNAG